MAKKITEKDLEKTKFIVLENFSNDSIDIKVYKGRKINQEDVRAFNFILVFIFITGILVGLLIGLIAVMLNG